ncbi:DUF445 domain-containing protein [Roseomonas sp. NAR14]|uniref:DUF445 domain-containing protein n=1 Tax=Roseomonas acroporae TaxID=2937791 RepID=A0A9X2BXN6_9PROT|nr:DUF445 domain-containing protein [Roseomonas acroporae]MCK8787436.1 DUF445 domain-containing protein [Roseomonas acroporae]
MPAPPDAGFAPASIPVPAEDPEAPLRRALRRHRAIATGLLLLMAGLMLGTYWMPPGYWTELLQAAAKAGVVGGLADWFAVTALFRHPLGLPIPHTAIIPSQKERLGRGLGRFVANHVFTEAEVRRVIGRLDLAAILRGFLSDPDSARPAAQAMAQTLPGVLASLGDGRARRLLGRLLPRVAGGPGGAKVLARVLRVLMAGGQHQEVFGLAVAQIKILLQAREAALRDAIARRVRDEGGALVGWLAGAAVARRVLSALNAELGRIEPGDSELRAAFETWLLAEIERLENDPERAASVGRALRDAVSHPAVAAWLGDVWARLRAKLEEDASRPEGRTVTLLEGAFRNAGEMLASDPAARDRLNRLAEAMLMRLLPAARTRIADFIAGVVQNWDTATVTERIELRVGRDLQYVRMNGTLVGFLVGGALYALLKAVFGVVAE